ncbi:MAG: response regulator transcription factor [Desulfobacterales bacterium]|nr:response regulator transcription factor [Desulfobacterales bacterium]
MSAEDARTILIIEDDRHTAALVALYLERDGFSPLVATDGRAGLALAGEHRPALVILDLMLPHMDGWEVCRRLRQDADVPVIMLTARDEESDRVAGLTLGADDYVVKPFSPRELVARVRAVLRRSRPTASAPARVLAQAQICLDLDRRRLTVQGRSVDLTPREYALLRALMAKPGRTFTRDELLTHLYPDGDAVVIARVVDVHIGKLRQKIEPDPARPRHILTVRGLGYRFADPEPGT